MDLRQISDGDWGITALHQTNQTDKPCEISVRHTACTGCGFVTRYENMSNLEQHYITSGTDDKELADRLTVIQHMERPERLGSTSRWEHRIISHICRSSFLLSLQKRSLHQVCKLDTVECSSVRTCEAHWRRYSTCQQAASRWV